MAECTFITRGEFADLMAAYMKGEITPAEFHKKTDGAATYDDPAARTIADELWYHYDGLKNKPVSLSSKAWDQFSRWIAFLRSDLTLEAKWPNLIKIPSWVPALLVVILAVSCRAEPRIFFLVWFLTGVLWALLVYLRDHRNLAIRNGDADFQHSAQFAPFLSESDWQAHKHLLDKYNLPEYSPEVHGGPDRDDYRPQTSDLQIFIIMVFLPLVLLYSIICDQRLEHFHIFLRQMPDVPDTLENC